MTDFNQSLGFQFRVSSVTGSFQAQTEQHVHKRVEKILYLESPPNDAVLLSYIGSKELSPANNLYIGDRSDSLYANSRAGKIQEVIGDTGSSAVYVRNSNFIVTQVFNDVDSGSIPLYYKHVLPLDIVPESVRVYDQDFAPVSTDKYRLEIQQEYDEDTGLPLLDSGNPVYTEYHLYNNLESSFDPTTGEYVVWFVQYTDSSGSTNLTVTQLLSNELAYNEATFDDIWGLTLELKPWIKAYTWDQSTMSIMLPSGTQYAIKYQEYKRISVKQPVATDDVHPWFPRIVNGKILTGYANYTMSYEIAEFSNQAFNPLEPYKVAVRQTCQKIDKYLIKLPHENLVHGSLFSYFYMIFELDGIVKYALTNDPYSNGTQYRDFNNQIVLDDNGDPVEWSSDLILGLDSLSGIVHVDFLVLDAYDITATYSYKEQYYEVTGLNMNPIFDQSAASEVRAIYIVPTSTPNGNLTTQTESVRWVKISSSGKIIATNQDGTGNNEILNTDVALESTYGYRLSGVIGLHYNWRASCAVVGYEEAIAGGEIVVNSTSIFPRSGWIRFLDQYDVMRYARFTSKTDTSLILSSNQNEVAYTSSGVFLSNNTVIELVNFIDERTTLSERLHSYELAHVPSADFYPPSFSRYFILAEMSINPPHSHNDLVHIDIRQDGGGIDPDKYEEAKAINPEAQWLANYCGYNGQVYPGNAVMVVKLPISILDSFNQHDIQRIVESNVALGVKPIIRYYGYQPNIIYVGPVT
jgi:hypothetical protein